MLLSPLDFKSLSWSDVTCSRAIPSGNDGTPARKLQDCMSALAFELNRVLNHKGYFSNVNRFASSRHQDSVRILFTVKTYRVSDL